MKHIVSLSVAIALAGTLATTAEAKPKKSEIQKHPSAAAVQKSFRSAAPRPAKQVAFHQQQRARFSAPSKQNKVAQRNVAVRQNVAAQRALSQQRAIASQRSVAVQRNRLAPIAERRGYVSPTYRSSTVTNRVDARHYDFNISNRYYRPPYEAYRGWDTRHVHWWNSRPYRWFGGEWILYSDYDPYDSATVLYAPGGGYSTSLVSDVQAALANSGYDPGPVDGLLGSGTRNAISAYQADHGLNVTGRIDGALLRSLGL